MLLTPKVVPAREKMGRKLRGIDKNEREQRWRRRNEWKERGWRGSSGKGNSENEQKRKGRSAVRW